MRACAPNVAIAPASSKTPSAREPTRSTTERAGMKAPLGSFSLIRGSSRLDHDPSCSTEIHAIQVSVLARHGEVALGLHLDGDDLAARQSLKRNHCRQVLLERFLVLGKRRYGEERQHENGWSQDRSALVHGFSFRGWQICSGPRAGPKS